MRRAIRIFFHLVAGLMFLLGACVLVLWVRSYWGQDTGIATRRLAPGSLPSERRPDAQVFGLISVAGGLGFIYGSHDPAISLMQTDWQYEQSIAPTYPTGFSEANRFHYKYWRFELAGIEMPGLGDRPLRGTWLIMPHWTWALLLLTWPVARGVRGYRRWKRRGRASPTACPGCGYDLRATPDGQGALLDRCPECGRSNAIVS